MDGEAVKALKKQIEIQAEMIKQHEALGRMKDEYITSLKKEVETLTESVGIFKTYVGLEDENRN